MNVDVFPILTGKKLTFHITFQMCINSETSHWLTDSPVTLWNLEFFHSVLVFYLKPTDLYKSHIAVTSFLSFAFALISLIKRTWTAAYVSTHLSVPQLCKMTKCQWQISLVTPSSVYMPEMKTSNGEHSGIL